jgi:hypothetical protein
MSQLEVDDFEKEFTESAQRAQRFLFYFLCGEKYLVYTG